MHRPLALVLLAAALAACTVPAPSLPTQPAVPAPPAVRFVVLGDAGTGGPDQYAVAAAMARACAARGCDFALELGDNLYDAGASGPDDPQFVEKFEKPYANLTFPFWLVLGNHDNSQDPAGTGSTGGLGTWYQSGDHEVAYSYRTDRLSEKWHMPARYYNMTAGPADHPIVAFFALDTNTLVFEDIPFPPDLEAKVRAQAGWVDGALAAAQAPWKIAFGHHPYLSNGPHGNAGAYDGHAGIPALSGDYLKQFFEDHVCGKVQLYLAGHDHDLQELAPTPACPGTAFLLSGGGGAATYPLVGSDPALFQAQTLGFWWLELAAAGGHAIAFDGDGQALFETDLAPAAAP